MTPSVYQDNCAKSETIDGWENNMMMNTESANVACHVFLDLFSYLFSNVMAYRLFDTLNFYSPEPLIDFFQIKVYRNLFVSAILVVMSCTEHEHQAE